MEDLLIIGGIFILFFGEIINFVCEGWVLFLIWLDIVGLIIRMFLLLFKMNNIK